MLYTVIYYSVWPQVDGESEIYRSVFFEQCGKMCGQHKPKILLCPQMLFGFKYEEQSFGPTTAALLSEKKFFLGFEKIIFFHL